MWYVIAYDIKKNNKRTKINKLLKQHGHPINYSVFECNLKKKALKEVIAQLEEWMNPKTDCIAIYPICKTCLGKSVYIPERNFDDTDDDVITII